MDKRSRGRPVCLPAPEIVSSDTLRAEHLVGAMLDALGRLRLTRRERADWYAARRILRDYLEAEEDGEAGEDLRDDLDWACNETLFDMMNNHCPPYCYYGSSDGDGALFGVWPDVWGVEEDMRGGEIARIGEDGAPPAGWVGLAAMVNDHGNVTLYDVKHGGRMVELWSAV